MYQASHFNVYKLLTSLAVNLVGTAVNFVGNVQSLHQLLPLMRNVVQQGFNLIVQHRVSSPQRPTILCLYSACCAAVEAVRKKPVLPLEQRLKTPGIRESGSKADIHGRDALST